MSGLVWSETLSGRKIHCALGERDVFIIAPDEAILVEPHSDDVVPRRKTSLTEQEQTRLSNQGVPREFQEDDLTIMKTKFANDRTCFITEEISQRNSAPSEITKVNILKRIEIFLKTSMKPRGQLCVYLIMQACM